VKMSVQGKVFCYATSRVILTDSTAVEAVESKGIGIAQLYKHFAILPRFYLTDAGVLDGCQLWREYVLSGGGIECRIREDFCPNYLDLCSTSTFPVQHDGGYGESPKDPSPASSTSSLSGTGMSPHMGDLMKGTSCLNILDEKLALSASPFQRALLTAAGNFTRIFTSYYKVPVSSCLLHSTLMPGSGQMECKRSLLMFCNGVAILRARSLITIESPELQSLVKSASDVASLFRRANLLPDFELLQVELDAEGETPGFGRRYTLKAPGVAVEIVEEFSEDVLHIQDPNLPAQDSNQNLSLKGIPLIFQEFAVQP